MFNKIREQLIPWILKIKKRGAFHIVVGSFMTKFISFFGSIFLVRVLTKSEYGILSYYENLTSYFILLVGMGLASGIQRYIVLADSISKKYSYFVYALKKGTIYNICLIGICSVICILYPHPEVYANHYFIGIILVTCIPFVFCLNMSLSTMRGLFDYRKYAYLAFCTSSFIILSRIIGAWIGSILGTVLARLTAEIVCAVISVMLVRNGYFSEVVVEVLPNEFRRRLNSYSLQMMVTDGLWAIFMLNDLFIIGQFINNELLVADYKVAYVIPANLAILTSAIGTFIAPYFTKNENDMRWITRKMRVVLCLTIVIMGVAVLFCILFAEQIIVVIYGIEYLTSVPIMKVLLIASFLNNGFRAPVANVLSAMGMQKYNLYIAALGIVLQIFFDITLLSYFGVIGVAISSVIVYFIMGISLFIIFQKEFKTR